MSRLRYVLAGLLVGAPACSSPTEPTLPGVAAFVVEVSREQFVVRVATEAQAADLRARMRSGTPGVISGALAQGTGGFNAPWRWHLDPASVEVVDVAIELCDGRPSMVEADLTYWMGSVRRFCPWSARVVREQ